MPSKDKDFAFSISFGQPEIYVKAVTGTFDESFFTDPQTGQFKFPDYNSSWKGMVRFKDVTKYKRHYFYFLTKKEIAQFNLDKFECDFFTPDLQVEIFPNFIRRFPEASFKI
jgi:hypothetical protein